MDDDASKANPTADFNKIDLSQLQGFSFGTQWAKDKEAPSQGRDHSERPAPRRPGAARAAPPTAATGAPSASPRATAPRRRRRGTARATAAPGGTRATMSRSAADRGMDRQDRQDRGPYDSPYFNVSFFPEDTSFNALVKTIRTSARTIELFEIARTVLGKPDRFVVVVSRKPRAAGRAGGGAPADLRLRPGRRAVRDRGGGRLLRDGHLPRQFLRHARRSRSTPRREISW